MYTDRNLAQNDLLKQQNHLSNIKTLHMNAKTEAFGHSVLKISIIILYSFWMFQIVSVKSSSLDIRGHY